MVESAYSFCPFDGQALVVEKRHGQDYQVCGHCRRTLYTNQHLTVSAVIVKEGSLLVVERAVEPFKGMWDLPGGFVEKNESAREGILRELKEELNVEAKILKPFEVLGPDPYPFEGVTHQNADMLYQVDIGQGKPEPHDDVLSLKWVKVSELEPKGFAFPSHRQFIAGLKAGTYTLI